MVSVATRQHVASFPTTGAGIDSSTVVNGDVTSGAERKAWTLSNRVTKKCLTQQCAAHYSLYDVMQQQFAIIPSVFVYSVGYLRTFCVPPF